MIVWLEDNVSTIENLRAIIQREFGLKPCVLSSPAMVMTYLEEELNSEDLENATPVLLIDIMLRGVRDLDDLGVKNAPTTHGKHAGYVFADRVLRQIESSWKNIPVCFITERDVDDALKADVEALDIREGGPVGIFRKYKDSDIGELVDWLREKGKLQ